MAVGAQRATARFASGRARALVRAALLALVVACVSAVPSSASAAVTRVCVDLDLGPHMHDASPRDHAETGEGPAPPPSEFAGDYREHYGRWEGEHPFPAQRWLARVIDETTGEPLWGFAPLDENGCTGATPDVEYDAPTTFRIEYVRWAQFDDDRAIIGYDCHGPSTLDALCVFGLPGNSPEFSDTSPQSAISPVSSGTTYVTIVPYYEEPDEVGEDITILAPIEYPLWAASFAEERVQVWTQGDFQVYIGHAFSDTDVLGDLTRVTRQFGGQPSINITLSTYRQKFAASHEYGHIQQAVVPGIPISASVVDYDYDSEPFHDWTSREWQSAACIEGFAQVYSAWTWNHPGTPGGVFLANPDLPASRIPVPVEAAICSTGCGPGVGNEWDWASALYEFRRQSGWSMAETHQLLLLAYGDGMGWVASGATSDFWDNFLVQLDLLMTPQELEIWEEVAEEWAIDR